MLWAEIEERGSAVWDWGWDVVIAREEELPSG